MAAPPQTTESPGGVSVKKNISRDCHNGLPNGLITLKGGELQDELRNLPQSEVVDVAQYFQQPFFDTKKIVYTPVG